MSIKYKTIFSFHRGYFFRRWKFFGLGFLWFLGRVDDDKTPFKYYKQNATFTVGRVSSHEFGGYSHTLETTFCHTFF